ncbi:hypothetical protein [Lelliottia wanjuensis]|uniref:hypothetical protein n=1 Tax=Lelliottia wanjuensis TaxID=3050585 RepID=UPI00254B67B7|nr:hypothetical protein [Lelliottia sp. V86_10]MDK9585882.1 hypothetical protein [Lelliottia sp. V86_10]
MKPVTKTVLTEAAKTKAEKLAIKFDRLLTQTAKDWASHNIYELDFKWLEKYRAFTLHLSSALFGLSYGEEIESECEFEFPLEWLLDSDFSKLINEVAKLHSNFNIWQKAKVKNKASLVLR